MAALTTGRDQTVLSFLNASFVFTSNGVDYAEHLLEHTYSDSTEESEDIDVSMVICTALSHFSDYFTCCIHKDLYLWRTKDWKLVSKRLVNRSASAIIFSPNDEVIAVADKSGDVFLFSVKSPEKEGEFILGHISMLLDLLITPNNKYIITCDRDEKIRVSCFPNAYNIQSYCLGHEEFVTCLNILPHNENILVSGSGDGTLRFWNYVCGKQLLCRNCNQNGSEFSSNNNPIISKLKSKKHSAEVSILVAMLVSFKDILVYNINSEAIEGELTCILKQKISLESEPWCISLSDDNLVILKQNVEECLSAYVFCRNKNEFVLDNCVTPIVNSIKKHTGKLNIFNKERQISTLYKRRFDNVQEYLKRKLERIETNTKKLKNKTTSEMT
ncbi:tRNA (guanine-N(7)-)-methyltransferase non-catalytic subunit wuho [Rhodnius prolixus]|uniref:tRNA (guanine-N(7)-)-methyltransferase non-catalytic subunit wuho n=1 Tax=Rhodnius prolixus TaxID=13249 RepID=T1IGJ1_RHOPR